VSNSDTNNEAAGTRPVLTTVSAVMFTVAAVLPSFLLGGLASLVRPDLRFDEAQLGLAVGAFYGASAVAATPGGRLAERLGARRSFVIGLALAITSLTGIALFTRSWLHLVAFLIVAGGSNGVTQSAGSLAIARGVRPGRRGFALGIKQSAVPTASLLAGLAVPLIGLTIGWRWAFGFGAIASLALLAILPARELQRPRTAAAPHVRVKFERREMRSLLVIAVASGCGAVAANSMGAFYVESAVAGGTPLGIAGLLLSLGSVTGIGTRLGMGWLADRNLFDPVRMVGAMMVVGTLGFLALGHLEGFGVLLVATVVAFAAGWGWPGLMQFAVVEDHLHAPAAASGIAHSGSLTGGLVGPIVFGWVVSRAGYATGWTMVTCVALFGGSLLLFERRSARRTRQPVSEILSVGG
jgi:predicted MFS family arabinose efflux permease